MEIRIDVYHHADPAVLNAINELKELIIMNQQELQADMATIAGQLDKITTEVQGLQTEIQDLDAKLANEDLDQSTLDAWNAVKLRVQGIDDLVPDAPPPAPAPAPAPEAAPAPDAGSAPSA